jgi:hypothetical protein
MTLENIYDVSHIFLYELLSFICIDLLPLLNCIPRLKNEIKCMIMQMSLEHVSKDCCPTGRLHYKKKRDYENLWKCL